MAPIMRTGRCKRERRSWDAALVALQMEGDETRPQLRWRLIGKLPGRSRTLRVRLDSQVRGVGSVQAPTSCRLALGLFW